MFENTLCQSAWHREQNCLCQNQITHLHTHELGVVNCKIPTDFVTCLTQIMHVQ